MLEPELVRLPIVLVIDDELANLRVFQRVFRRRYHILIATTWAEAHHHLQTTTPDVAFVDYSMPELDGVGMLQELRRLAPTVGRYLLTGYCDLATTIAAKDRDLCRGVLTKPWERRLIEAAVSECCGGLIPQVG